MVLRVRTPVVDISSLFLKDFERKYKLKPLPLKRYFTATLTGNFLNVPIEKVKPLLINANDLFAFEWNNTLYVHPYGVFKHVARKMKSKLNAEIRATSKLLSHQ